MSDDIVTRLLECWCAEDYTKRHLVDPACDHDGVRQEAAEEIESLRSLIKKFYLAEKRYIETCQQDYHDPTEAAVAAKEWQSAWEEVEHLVNRSA